MSLRLTVSGGRWRVLGSTQDGKDEFEAERYACKQPDSSGREERLIEIKGIRPIAQTMRWDVNRIEKFLRLTELQRTALDDVRAAVTKAADLKTGACPADLPRASAERRLLFTVQRFGTLHRVTASIEPKFQVFDASR